jgi:histidine phosphotransferase ChpT
MASLPELRLSQLLAARLCHELVGPVAAVANGIEALGEEPYDDAAEALTLAADSARRASSRLQIFRFAYGFGGEGHTAGPPASALSESYFAETRTSCHYSEHVRALTPAWQRLGCNLLFIGEEALARGGSLVLDAPGGELQLDAVGESVHLAPVQLAALALETPIEALTARTVQSYFTGLLARTQARRLVIEATDPGKLRLRTATLGA